MNLIKSAILFSLLFFSYSLSAETLLNESTVSKFIEKVTHAAKAKDVDKLTSYLSDDISMTLEIPKNMGGTQKFNKEQFRNKYKESTVHLKNYTYDLNVTDTRISQDKKNAIVTGKIHETYEENGMTVSIKGSYRLNLIVSNGTIKISNHYGKLLPKDVTVTPIASSIGKIEKPVANKVIEKWKLVSAGKDSVPSFYFNSDSLQKKNNNVSMPVLADYKSAQVSSTGKYYKSSKSEFEHDCNKKQYRIVNLNIYSGNNGKGKLLKKYTTPGEWSPVNAGKVTGRLWSHACEQQEKVAGL